MQREKMFINSLRFLVTTLLAALLVACGGGGSSSPPTPQTPSDQTITFATPISTSGSVGTTITNTASGGGGTGGITYASSNISVATVNATTGVVTLLAVGSTTITATKAASSGFNAASSNYTLTVTQGSQTIAFAQAGPLQLLSGNSLGNAASGGNGTGTVTYVSSNTSVATINASTGVVTGAGAGIATITATKAADVNYSGAQATYSVSVVDSAAFGAWIGGTDAQVVLPASANGARLLRSRQRNCNLTNVLLCTSGQSDTIIGAPATVINDSAATLSNAAYYSIQTDTLNASAQPVNAGRFSERMGHGALYFNNRYWVLGGAYNISANARAEIWSSVDGRVWELETNAAPFGARWLQQSVVFNNKMWVIGGINTADVPINDVWSSSDGANWTREATSLPFASSGTRARVAVFNNALWAIASGNVYKSTDGAVWSLQATNVSVGGGTPRPYASLTSFSGKLWYIGGAPGFVPNLSPPNASVNSVNEVWSSPDGLTWTLQPVPPFGGRFQHASFVLNNRLWVFGGRAVINGVPQLSISDAWSTNDGTSWTQEARNTELDQWYLATPVENESGKVTLIGGILRGWSNMVYQSTDGNAWNELSPYAQFAPRLAAGAVSFLGDLWVIGGATLGEVDGNDIWRSSDGINWTRVTPSTSIFSPRDSHKTLVFNNRIWVIGGWGNTVSVGGTGVRLNDVWSSADGIVWRQETPNAGFTARMSFAATVHNGRMWVIGGETGTGAFINDVWSSSDGISWMQETSSAAFSARGGLSVVSFNGELWLTGGGNVGFIEGGGTAQSDVWKSSNGTNWTLVSTIGSVFSPRVGHSLTVYNNRIWVMGGFMPGVGYNSEVWSSADGINWNAATTTAPFGARSVHSTVAHNGELWLIAGNTLQRHNDVWRSTDGINWRVGFNGVIRMH